MTNLVRLVQSTGTNITAISPDHYTNDQTASGVPGSDSDTILLLMLTTFVDSVILCSLNQAHFEPNLNFDSDLNE